MSYWIFPLIGIALCALLLFLRLSADTARLRFTLLALLLGAFFAFLGAKLFSLLLDWRQWAAGDWREVLWNGEASAFCLTGGCAGAVLGGSWAARWQRVPPMAGLDAFAPGGALVIACFRWAEKELGRLGAGLYVAPESVFARFPFSVQNDWGESYLAVFTLEALWALALCVFFLLRRPKRTGDTFRWTAWLLCAGQIFWEDLRSRGMMMGFVHTEQVLCGLICLVLCGAACRRAKHKAPFWFTLGVIVLIGLTEFGRQKANWLFLSEWGFALIALECIGLCVPYALLQRSALRGAD